MKILPTLLLVFTSVYSIAGVQKECESHVFSQVMNKKQSPFNCQDIDQLDLFAEDVLKLSPVDLSKPVIALKDEILTNSEYHPDRIEINLTSKIPEVERAVLSHELGHHMFYYYVASKISGFGPLFEKKWRLQSRKEIAIKEIPHDFTLIESDGRCSSQDCILANQQLIDAISVINGNDYEQFMSEIEAYSDFDNYLVEYIKPFNELAADAVSAVYFKDPSIMKKKILDVVPNEKDRAACRNFLPDDLSANIGGHYCVFSALRFQIYKNFMEPNMDNPKKAIALTFNFLTSEILRSIRKQIGSPFDVTEDDEDALKNRDYEKEFHSMLFNLELIDNGKFEDLLLKKGCE